MAENCLNCGNIIAENFCSNCGQKKFKRIDRKYVIDELQYSFIHTNKGFFYSVKNIVKNPGRTARAFIEGNRVNHYKPLLLAFVLSGISALISFKLMHFDQIIESEYSKQNINKDFAHQITVFLSNYISIISLLSIPLFALFTKITFRKWGQNYYEHIIMNAIILSYYTILSIVIVYPIMYLFKDEAMVFRTVSFLSMFSMPFILIWFFKSFYPERSIKTIILRIILLFIVLLIAFMITIVAISFVYVFYLAMTDPEALKVLQANQAK